MAREKELLTERLVGNVTEIDVINMASCSIAFKDIANDGIIRDIDGCAITTKIDEHGNPVNASYIKTAGGDIYGGISAVAAENLNNIMDYMEKHPDKSLGFKVIGNKSKGDKTFVTLMLAEI